MIHGGLRYLEHGAFRLVRESLAEREVLLKTAPHLVRPMRFVLPHGSGQRPRWRRRRTNQVRRPWPARQDHKPPKTPKFRRMGTDLKELLARTLSTPADAVC